MRLIFRLSDVQRSHQKQIRLAMPPHQLLAPPALSERRLQPVHLHLAQHFERRHEGQSVEHASIAIEHVAAADTGIKGAGAARTPWEMPLTPAAPRSSRSGRR